MSRNMLKGDAGADAEDVVRGACDDMMTHERSSVQQSRMAEASTERWTLRWTRHNDTKVGRGECL
jgi:hypothetical protein